MRDGIENGWLADAVYRPSPNQGPRHDPADISLVVVHNISLPPGEFGTGFPAALFCNTLDASCHPALADLADVTVSAHVLIERDGQVTQFVSFDQRAWHAGDSCYDGRENCNDYSIGIELEGTDDTPYTDAQYRTLIRLIGLLRQHYPAITPGRVVGHADVAPGRKTDPGVAFDWVRVRQALSETPGQAGTQANNQNRDKRWNFSRW